MQHWQRSHNEHLRYWLEAEAPDIRFVVRPARSEESIDQLERHYIHRFQPVANRTLT